MIDLSEIEKIFPSVVKFRRHIHENPELGLDTADTKRYVKEYSDSLGFQTREVGNGLIVESGNSPKIALRADMDALPIRENTGLPFSSKIDGRMHACGHDVHTATLMGAMTYVKEKTLPPVRFIFQPGEEIGKGAALMIEGGAMEGIQNTFGLHAWPSLGVGEYSILKGRAMAAVDEFDIKVSGTGGHGAYPHLAYDTVLESSRIIQRLLAVPARRIDPLNSAVLSIGYVNGGKARNIIPSQVEIGGTVRTFNVEDSAIIEKEVLSLEGEHVNVHYSKQLPPLINNPVYATNIDGVALNYLKNVQINPTMGGEDFSLYCKKSNASFAFLGTGKINGREVSKHSNVMDVNEEAMKYGIILHISAIVAASSKE